MPRAILNQTLLYYDEPQILLLTTARNIRVLAVSVPEHPDMTWPFFGCEVVERNFRRYMAGKADLHYVFKSAKTFYMFSQSKRKKEK